VIALQILQHQYETRSSQFIFPGHRDNRPMSNTAMLSVLQRLGVEVTVRGFRSTFRDWAGDPTRFRRDLIELALAHTVGNATELAYRRRELMNAWAAYCALPPQADNIVPMIKAIPA
jgi:integrase